MPRSIKPDKKYQNGLRVASMHHINGPAALRCSLCTLLSTRSRPRPCPRRPRPAPSLDFISVSPHLIPSPLPPLHSPYTQTMSQDKGYYASQPPQYPQQAQPAYGQPAYGQAASYQPGYPPQPAYGQPGYPPSPQGGYYAQRKAPAALALWGGSTPLATPLLDSLTNMKPRLFFFPCVLL